MLARERRPRQRCRLRPRDAPAPGRHGTRPACHQLRPRCPDLPTRQIRTLHFPAATSVHEPRLACRPPRGRRGGGWRNSIRDDRGPLRRIESLPSRTASDRPHRPRTIKRFPAVGCGLSTRPHQPRSFSAVMRWARHASCRSSVDGRCGVVTYSSGWLHWILIRDFSASPTPIAHDHGGQVAGRRAPCPSVVSTSAMSAPPRHRCERWGGSLICWHTGDTPPAVPMFTLVNRWYAGR